MYIAKPVDTSWQVAKIGRNFISLILRYTWVVAVPSFRPTSVFGFGVLITMINQFVSGFLLSLYYLPDSSLISTFREEYLNEIWFFWYVYKCHVIGVDSIFILSYLHICQKIYIKNFFGADLSGWLSGTYAFLVFHVVVFLGITLSANHLGDLTLTIGANMFWSIFLFKHKVYTILFTNKHLNMDESTRLMIAHYLVACYYAYLLQSHIVNIHNRWTSNSKVTSTQDGESPKSSWASDAWQKESIVMLVVYVLAMSWSVFTNLQLHLPVEIGYFEQWGEAEMEEMNFYIVSPHWYFRPHMGLLTVCSQHYEGLVWLAFFYVALALLPLWSRAANTDVMGSTQSSDFIPMSESGIQTSFYIVFIFSMLYVGSALPCARFYYDGVEGFFGNSVLRLSYQYIYTYLVIWLHWLDRVERMFSSKAGAGEGIAEGKKEKDPFRVLNRKNVFR